MSAVQDYPRTHYTKVVRRRNRFAKEAVPEELARKITVRFYGDYHKFVANVAHQLRHVLKYRSDGGKTARGLVAHSDPNASLYKIHMKARGEWKWVEGQQYWLWALIYRRNSPNPSERWVTMIQFSRFWSRKDMEGEDVDTPMNPAERVEEILIAVKDQAGTISGDRGRRIRAYLDLALRVGYPDLLQLWHYNPYAVREFVQADRFEPELAKRMIQEGGGFPLKGKLPGNWQHYHPSWRTYPFQEILPKLHGNMSQLWMLEEVDKNIAKSVYELSQAFGGKGAGGERAVSSEVYAFRTHIVQLAKTRGTLYYESDRNTVDRRSLLERL